MKKDLVVLVSTNLRDVNLCLLGSLIKGYHNDEGKIWKSIVDGKCVIDNRFSKHICKKPTPHFLFLESCDAAARATRFGYRW
jgi:hypothetical protein